MAGQANFDRARMLGHYRTMARIRAFEEAAEQALKDGHVKGAIHLSIGQEAIAAGVCAHLVKSDAMFGELFGRANGTCQGNGGSMHIADFSIGMLGANGVVGAGIEIAAGAAHGVKLRGERRVVVCFFGDGATNRGPFLEGLNWAKIYELPILFVCEDNGFAATTRTTALSAGPGPAARAASLGLPTLTVDGNDIAAVDAAAGELTQRIRTGGGPHFLLVETYRLKGHTAADAATYRTEDEVAAKRLLDPLLRCADALRVAGASPSDLGIVTAAAQLEMRQAVEAALAAPWPVPELLWADVQDTDYPRAGMRS